MTRALVAPVLWGLAAVLLVLQRTSDAFASGLDAYDRGANALGRAVLRGARRLVVWLGPLGRLLRALAAPVWRRVRALWRWLNVQLLLRMFRPLRRLGRWVVRLVAPRIERLVVQLRRLLAAVHPLLVRLSRGVEAVERAASRLSERWRRLWAPVMSTVARWRRRRPA